MELKQMYTAIVAAGSNNEIGKDNDLLWHLPKDMKWFKEHTQGADVIMGRNSYEALPDKYRPLPKRTNIVITRQEAYSAPKGVHVVNSLEGAFKVAEDCDETKKFIIGGGQIYTQALAQTNQILLTRVHGDFPEADAFFPELDMEEWIVAWREDHPADEKHKYAFSFIHLVRRLRP